MLSSLLAPVSRTRAIFYAVGLAASLFAIQLLYWALRIRGAYFPTGDDFALIVHSTRVFHAHPMEWFTRGFADYFRPFPDLAIPYSEFLRPVDNGVYFLNSVLFNSNWAQYLWANYLIAAALASATFLLAARALKLPAVLTVLVTVAAAASPAYTYHVLYRPSFAFDYLGALWVLLCLMCLSERRLNWAWIFVLLAVFSKESAYFVAPAAAISVYLYSPSRTRIERWARALVFCLPLVLVFILRNNAFHDERGVYVLNGLTPKALVRDAILGLTRWPYMVPGDQHIFEVSLHNLGSLLLSGVLWFLLLFSLRAALRRSSPTNSSKDSTASAEGMLLIFLLGSLCLPIGLNLGTRFGASTFPLLFLMLGTLARSSPDRRLPRLLALASLVIITMINVALIGQTFSSRVLASQAQTWALSRNFLHHLQTGKSSVYFLLTDATENFSSPDAMKRFAKITAEVIPVLDLSPGSCHEPLSLSVPAPSTARFHVKANCGGELTLFGTGQRSADAELRLIRHLATADLAYDSTPLREDPHAYSWKELDLTLKPKNQNYEVLALDPDATSYQVVQSNTAP